MKRFLIMAAAMLAFMSCTKDIQEINQEIETEGTAFVAGQEVTIRCGNPQTKVSGTEKDNKDISFLWEAGDKIKVTVGGASSVFTLVSGAGTKTATFVGNMPASGTTFDIQYPETDPDLSSQTYSEGKLPAGKMKFTASDCSLDATATLTAAYAALRLNLYGYDRAVTQIAVTNTTASPNVTCTLTCGEAVQVGSDSGHATPFLIVIPSGQYNFTIGFTTNAITGAAPTVHYLVSSDYGVGTLIPTRTISTRSKKTFDSGSVYDMPSASLTTIWAPVNCGHNDEYYKYGKLYQFGRKIGCGYKGTTDPDVGDSSDQTSTNATYTSGINSKLNDTDFNSYFYATTAVTGDWYSDQNSLQLASWPMKSTDAGFLSGKIQNPCPNGWRVPTWVELNSLLGGNYSGSLVTGTGYFAGKKGKYFDGTGSATSGVFLPAAGFRSPDDKLDYNRGAYGYYWSLSAYDGTTNRENAWLLFFDKDGSTVLNSRRAHAFSVRCVQQ